MCRIWNSTEPFSSCIVSLKVGEIELVKRNDVILKTVRDAIGGLPPLEDGQTDPNDILHRASKLNSINKKELYTLFQVVHGRTGRKNLLLLVI